MTVTNFRDLLVEELNRRSDAETEIRYKTITKNNSTKWEALVIRKGGRRLAPTVYIDDLYKKHRAGKQIGELAAEVLEEYDRVSGTVEIGEDFFSDYEEVRQNIYMKLVSAEKNAEALRKMPFAGWNDLALLCYYRMPAACMRRGTIQITEQHLELWGIGEEKLLADARKNTAESIGPEIRSLRELILMSGNFAGLCGEDDIPETPLYVLTGKEQYLGAVCITLPGVPEKIAEKFGGDYYMLPSSIHECLLLPDNGRYEPEELNRMVREVNRTQLLPEDILSDHAYHYNSDTRTFDI
jgi:hypothetical protein